VKQAPERELLQVILTLIPPRRFSRGLNRRQQKRDQDADDRNHDQELDQRKSGAVALCDYPELGAGQFNKRTSGNCPICSRIITANEHDPIPTVARCEKANNRALAGKYHNR
jgi:hypothetical protein